MRKAFVFDLDGTLLNTHCHVIVRDSMNVPYKSLTPEEFNTYELGNGESFDFSEFRDEAFIHSAEPTFLVHLAKEVYDEGHKVYILTAREGDVANAIRLWLWGRGIVADEVHCVGGTRQTIADNKKKVLLDIVETNDKIYFYDDSEENVNVFTHEKLRAYQYDY